MAVAGVATVAAVAVVTLAAVAVVGLMAVLQRVRLGLVLVVVLLVHMAVPDRGGLGKEGVFVHIHSDDATSHC